MEFKAVGVSFENRQEILSSLYALSRPATLDLCPEPDNAYDPNAVAIWSEFGKVGYIARDCTHLVADRHITRYRFLGSPASILGLIITVE